MKHEKVEIVYVLANTNYCLNHIRPADADVPPDTAALCVIGRFRLVKAKGPIIDTKIRKCPSYLIAAIIVVFILAYTIWPAPCLRTPV